MKILSLLVLSFSLNGLSYKYYRDGGALSVEFMRYIKNEFCLKNFVETGTCYGDTSERAVRVFDKVFTVELAEEFYKLSRKRLSGFKNVFGFMGDSPSFLRKILATLKEPSLVFLDAHYCGDGSGTAKGSKVTPIQEELEVIFRVSKSNIILIDDVRHFQSDAVKEFQKSLGHLETGHLDYPSWQDIVAYTNKFNYNVVLFGDLALLYCVDVYPNIEISPLLKHLTDSRSIFSSKLSDFDFLKNSINASGENELKQLAIFLKEWCDNIPQANRESERTRFAHYNLWNYLYKLSLGKETDLDVYFINA